MTAHSRSRQDPRPELLTVGVKTHDLRSAIAAWPLEIRNPTRRPRRYLSPAGGPDHHRFGFGRSPHDQDIQGVEENPYVLGQADTARVTDRLALAVVRGDGYTRPGVSFPARLIFNDLDRSTGQLHSRNMLGGHERSYRSVFSLESL